MRHLWLSSALALAALCAAACSTQAVQATPPPSPPAGPSYREAADQLIAATRTEGPLQSTTMREESPCTFAFDIAPGRQSYLQFSFDVRELDLNAVSAASGQARHSAFSRRIACTAADGLCASYTGMQVDFIEIASPTAEDMDRALDALRHLQSLCRSGPPSAE